MLQCQCVGLGKCCHQYHPRFMDAWYPYVATGSHQTALEEESRSRFDVHCGYLVSAQRFLCKPPSTTTKTNLHPVSQSSVLYASNHSSISRTRSIPLGTTMTPAYGQQSKSTSALSALACLACVSYSFDSFPRFSEVPNNQQINIIPTIEAKELLLPQPIDQTSPQSLANQIRTE